MYDEHRAAIEAMYTDTCTVYKMIAKKDENTKETKNVRAPDNLVNDQPCFLSQASGKNGQTEAQNNISYETKLFIAPELEIAQGAELTVTRMHVTRKYACGEPAIFPTHQEILLERKDWA